MSDKSKAPTKPEGGQSKPTPPPAAETGRSTIAKGDDPATNKNLVGPKEKK